MKATVTRKELADALAIAAPASSVRSSGVVLTSLKVEVADTGIKLVGCDGEMWAMGSCLARVEEPGSILVQQRLFSDIVTNLPDKEIELSLEGTQLYLRQGESEWKLMAYPPEDFPGIPEFEPNASLNLEAGKLRKGIASVAFAVSDDTGRAVLTGVLFTYDGESLTMVATDTHRMAVHKIIQEGIGSSVTAIVPEKALRIVRSLPIGDEETIRLDFDGSRISVDVGSAKIVSQLLSGQYPNWERVVPAEHTRSWTMDRVELFDNVKRAMILARDNANRIRFSGSGDKVVVSARSEDKGEAREEVQMLSKNGDVEIAFNGRYVMDVLQAMNSDGVRAEMTESSRAAVIRPFDSQAEEPAETFFLVMPMSIG